MRTARNAQELERPKGRHGFVPTMGALHEGHLSLIRAAKRECDYLTVSIFVNPLQFAPNEDFEKYPRPEQDDRRLCEEAGVDEVFTPEASCFLGLGQIEVRALGVSELFEGAHRPGHFDGVATIVAKLFNAVQPDAAYFGLKDRQQCAVIGALIRDLNYPIELKLLPTFREPDGLALSSRNIYLSPENRRIAPKLYQMLSECRARLRSERPTNAEEVERKLEGCIRKLTNFGFSVDYFELVDERSFTPTRSIAQSSVLITAARLGETRLIDNVDVFER